MINSEGQSHGRDRRQAIRHSCSKMTELFVQGHGYMGCIKNESFGGIFIETSGSFSVGQQVSVAYTSAAGLDQKKNGKIVVINPDGVGVKFHWPGYNR